VSASADWTPAAPIAAMRLRARLLSRIRNFFDARAVLEVETPLLGRAATTDFHIESLRVRLGGDELYLQSSPELAMKRLLAAGSGSIYQVCKAFRGAERGARHNPEFTMVEWYRVGMNHHQLMDEVELLLQEVLGTVSAERVSYEAIFQRYVGLNPHHATAEELEARARELSISLVSTSPLIREDWLNLLMTRIIEPKLDPRAPVFVFDFPVELEAMARIRPGPPPVAERFEVYLRGMELANGYHELIDAREQRERFLSDLERRRNTGAVSVKWDERLIAALESGMPACAGVALGLDRLLMVAAGTRSLDDILGFPVERA
jgi:lysyl-tRNA synthetase class 2